jgi:hypothetical protein
MIQGARVESGPDSAAYATIAEMTRTLLPAMQQTGAATAEEVDVESLAERLRDEAVVQNAVLRLPPLIGAWTLTSQR